MADLYLKLGDYSKPKPRGYVFNLDEWVNPLIIKNLDISIVPNDYFITTGEAVIKSTALESKMWSVYRTVHKKVMEELSDNFKDPVAAFRSNKLIKINKYLQECLSKCWRSASQSRNLVIHLIEARGTHLFLETDWSEGNIICYPKNPRGVKL